MQRTYLSPEDQKFVNRWRLIVIGLYSSMALVTILIAASHPPKDGGTLEARMQSTDLAQPVHVKR